MNTYHSLTELSQDNPTTSWGMLMGNFDGLHLGHQDLIKKTLLECQKQGLDLVVLSFNPHPICILKPGYQPFLINTYEQKKEFLAKLGVEYFVELNFNRDLSTQSPEEFLETHLLIHNQLKALYFGYDFTFGANKKGNFEFVKQYCHQRLIVKKLDVFKVDGLEISSSLIRKELDKGNVDKSAQYLGRPFFIEGLVTKGEGRGKKIGFPTANLSFHKDLIIPKREGELSFNETIKLPMEEWGNHFQNDFEQYAFNQYPEIEHIKKEMSNAGAIFSSMTGTGSTVYGFFKDKNQLPTFPSKYMQRVIQL